MRDQQGRSYFGVASAEQEFAYFPEVIRVIEWIERLIAVEAEHQALPTLRKPVVGAPNRDR
jgi:hypothetical protein